jgi:hypothetical protein
MGMLRNVMGCRGRCRCGRGTPRREAHAALPCG